MKPFTGRHFKAWRKRLGESISGIAREWGQDRRTIQRWENEKQDDDLGRVVELACKGYEAERMDA